MVIKFEPTKHEMVLLAATFLIGMMLGIVIGPLFMFGFIGAVLGGWGSWLTLNKFNGWRTKRLIERMRAVVRDELAPKRFICEEDLPESPRTEQEVPIRRTDSGEERRQAS